MIRMWLNCGQKCGQKVHFWIPKITSSFHILRENRIFCKIYDFRPKYGGDKHFDWLFFFQISYRFNNFCTDFRIIFDKCLCDYHVPKKNKKTNKTVLSQNVPEWNKLGFITICGFWSWFISGFKSRLSTKTK